MTERPKVHPIHRAWAAGVFDIKGVIQEGKLLVKIESTDEALINRFHETVGYGKIICRRALHSSLYTWQVVAQDDIREVLLFVLPLLSPRKVTSAGRVIAAIERKPTWRAQNPDKAKASISDIQNVQSADTHQPSPDTPQDGELVSPAERTSVGTKRVDSKGRPIRTKGRTP